MNTCILAFDGSVEPCTVPLFLMQVIRPDDG